MLVFGEHRQRNFAASEMKKSREFPFRGSGERSEPELSRDMQEVERDRSSSSDFKGDAAQAQRERRYLRFQEMAPRRYWVEHTKCIGFEQLAPVIALLPFGHSYASQPRDR